MRVVSVWVLCHLIALALLPPIWVRIWNGYAEDSFWFQTTSVQIGAVAITIGGLIIIGLICAWKTRIVLRWSQKRWRIPVWLLDVLLGLVVFALFYVMSSQVYYTFYRTQIPELPNQWVIRWLVDWNRLQSIALPEIRGSMADHAAAIGIGGLILFTSYLHRR